MAQRSSRSNKGNKARARKQPELRTGGGRQAKAARSRERNAAVARSAPTGPAVRMRPAGLLGYLWVLLFAWLGVAAVAVVGRLLDRWDTVGYPDSLWLYAAIGVVAVAPAVGRVARSGADADAWGVQALLVPVGLFVAEVAIGPDCPNGASCQSIGARGWLGTPLSIAVLVVAAVLAWALARWMYRFAARRRPASGRVRYGIAAAAVLTLLIAPGTVLAAALVATDLLVRDAPDLAQDATAQVEQECFGLQDAPALTVRAAPQGQNPLWTTYAVRRVHEGRPGIGKQSLPSDWVGLDDVYPYEATVSYDSDGEAVAVSCRKVAPDAGKATADDLKQADPESTDAVANKTIGHEFLPRFLADGQIGPTPEAAKKLAADAKAKAAKAAKAKATPAAKTPTPKTSK
ncbi:MAG: hypothetical protein JWM98_1164 [Thermoleophilia bacterium]|nr:hypothetical protein [Thermoleophilia bacterium]